MVQFGVEGDRVATSDLADVTLCRSRDATGISANASRHSVEDSDLSGFSDTAKQRLKKAAEEYVDGLIQEANRIEAARNTTNGPPEVTSGMVNDAVIVQRSGLGSPKHSLSLKLLRLASALLTLLVGIMYDAEKLQDQTYLVLFVLAIGAAIVTTTLSVLKE